MPHDFMPGLAGVPAATSSISDVDGQRGILEYRGIKVEELCAKSSYLETAYLLLFGHLPTPGELQRWTNDVTHHRRIKFRIIDLMKCLPEQGHPMDALQAAVAALGMFYPGRNVKDIENNYWSAVRLVAKLPTIVAAWARLRFVITRFTIGLKYIASDTPTNLQHLNAQVYTDVDTNTFAGNAANAAGIFNSSISMTIDRKVFLPAFPCRSFLRVPGTQTAANAFFTGSGQKLTNEYPNGQYGFSPSEPTLVDGRQTITISVDLENASAIDDTGYSVYGVLEFRRYLVVNSKS